MAEPKNVTAWIYCFAGFLTTRDEAILCGLPDAEWEKVEEEVASSC